MHKRCPKCRSTKRERNKVEMAFAPGQADPVYVLGKPIVCLDCGFAECFIPKKSLKKLRAPARA
jgi:predicted nucleic-acid-binding Zn-ribbon protein